MREDDTQPRTILFACTLNTVRSPMAAALMRHMVGPRVRVDSAGVRAGTLDILAAEALHELGIPHGGHHPCALADLNGRSYDLIIALSPEAHELAQAFEGAKKVEYWPVSDPTAIEGSREQRLCAYRAARDQLLDRLQSRFHMTPV